MPRGVVSCALQERDRKREATCQLDCRGTDWHFPPPKKKKMVCTVRGELQATVHIIRK